CTKENLEKCREFFKEADLILYKRAIDVKAHPPSVVLTANSENEPKDSEKNQKLTALLQQIGNYDLNPLETVDLNPLQQDIPEDFHALLYQGIAEYKAERQKKELAAKNAPAANDPFYYRKRFVEFIFNLETQVPHPNLLLREKNLANNKA